MTPSPRIMVTPHKDELDWIAIISKLTGMKPATVAHRYMSVGIALERQGQIEFFGLKKIKEALTIEMKRIRAMLGGGVS